MKGTLFSADFVKDSNGDLKLLELNTDTGFVSGSFSQLDLTDFNNILTDNSLSEVHVVYKEFQADFIDYLSQSLVANVPGVTTFTETLEDVGTVYPSVITDSDSKFILRLAYDESAIFDSSYAKDNIELYKLFIDNNNTGSISNFAYSASAYEFDNLTVDTLNSENNLPDVTVKQTLTSTYSPLQFYKAGNSGSAAADRLTALKADLLGGEQFIQQFYVEDASASKVSSIRSFNIIYGTNLDVVNIGDYEIEAILDKPTSIEVSDSVDSNELSIKHYFEFTTNGLRSVNLGVAEGTEIVKADGTSVLIESASTGEYYKSFFFSGSPDTDDVEEIRAWSYAGSTIPSGSYETSSSLDSVVKQENRYHVIADISISGSDGDSLLVSPYNYMLVHDSTADKFLYEIPYNLEVGRHKLFDIDGNFKDIDSINIQITEEAVPTYEANLSTVDTFYVGGVGVDIKVLTHNCFVAGTKITLADNTQKNIEDVTAGEEVLTYNEDKGVNENGVVGKVKEHQVESVIRLTLDNENVIVTTDEHPFYVQGKGFVKAKELNPLDVCKKENGDESVISTVEILEETHTVYNLLSVSDNHNFYANGILVHNK